MNRSDALLDVDPEQWRNLRYNPGGKGSYRKLEENLQHHAATQLFGIPSTRTRGAVSSQLANVNKLTNFALAHKQGADQINEQYRIVFKWIDGNAKDVLITDYH